MARKIEFDIPEKLSKAKGTFWEKGYHATSMQDLVGAMELNPGSIYGTFGDKHQLFIESLKMYCQQILLEFKNASQNQIARWHVLKRLLKNLYKGLFLIKAPAWR